MKTVSEWIKKGGFASGFYLLTKPVKETEKAVGFRAFKYNSYANPYETVCWFPRSLCIHVEDDYYDKPEQSYIVPQWLYMKKTSEFTLLAAGENFQ